MNIDTAMRRMLDKVFAEVVAADQVRNELQDHTGELVNAVDRFHNAVMADASPVMMAVHLVSITEELRHVDRLLRQYAAERNA